MDNIIVQTFRVINKAKLEKAIIFYSIVSVLNSLNLTRKQIELLAYTHVRGTISSLSAKEDFVKNYGSSVDSINNMISKLYKKKILFKVPNSGKIKVNPRFSKIDFDNPDIIINIIMENK